MKNVSIKCPKPLVFESRPKNTAVFPDALLNILEDYKGQRISVHLMNEHSGRTVDGIFEGVDKGSSHTLNLMLDPVEHQALAPTAVEAEAVRSIEAYDPAKGMYITLYVRS